MGSSPLTRGKPRCAASSRIKRGLIPAHAGKTKRALRNALTAQAHPRSRGENHGHRSKPPCPSGSSPLTRGKRNRRRYRDRSARLIPAHAGKTWSRPGGSNGLKAHPRSRGENACLTCILTQRAGSSPLTRGKRYPDRYADRTGGLIPAHAGKTPAARPRSYRWGAHPRSRGENSPSSPYRAASAGSSPLTRGKRGEGGMTMNGLRLIPAHAGKTDTGGVSTYGHGAHPRSRGENAAYVGDVPNDTGSSPLTRGKPEGPRGAHARVGLIPAHAGKTFRRQPRS